MKGSVRQRSGSWTAALYLGRHPETRKQRRKYSTHRTRREAEAWLAQEISRGACVALTPGRLTVAAYMNHWLEGVTAKETTRQIYRYCTQQLILPILGTLPLGRLGPLHIQEWLAALDQRKLSPATVHQAFRVLRTALRQAVMWRLLSATPISLVSAPRLTVREMRVWDEEETRLFLAEAKRSSRYYPLYLTALFTGLREGELLALRWEDIDWLNHRASVRQTLTRIHNTRAVFSEPKSRHSRRLVDLPLVVVETLKDLHASQHPGDLIFCQPTGKPLHGHNVTQRDFRKVMERAGVPRIRFHDLRHCHATHLLRAGVNPKVVQESLGHANITVTMDTYSHVLPGIQADAVRRLEDLLLGRSASPVRQDG